MHFGIAGYRVCKNLNQFEQRQRYSAMNNSAFPAQVYAVENLRKSFV
jgi:hypothetical protein